MSLAKLPSCCYPSLRKDREYHGVPGRSGGWGGMEYCRGTWEPERDGKRKTGEELQPSHPTSKCKSLPNASAVNKLESEQASQVRLRGQGVRNEIW